MSNVLNDIRRMRRDGVFKGHPEFMSYSAETQKIMSTDVLVGVGAELVDSFPGKQNIIIFLQKGDLKNESIFR
ncbi:hypothetical protein [Achromobacter sp. MFA1 R4]|uniref:hypothetical protein n=1 Tax=Achromobacter sp. MFA1 R4 TaxID=1881016 RepID=UPI0012EB370E|nr:hypothetical protein [Achromobacter sp. MFA1 R4]